MGFLKCINGKIETLGVNYSSLDGYITMPVTEPADLAKFGTPSISATINFSPYNVQSRDRMPCSLAMFSFLKDAFSQDWVVDVWFELVGTRRKSDGAYVPPPSDENAPFDWYNHYCHWAIVDVDVHRREQKYALSD